MLTPVDSVSIEKSVLNRGSASVFRKKGSVNIKTAPLWHFKKLRAKKLREGEHDK